MAKYCSHCGNSIESNSKFCGNCGSSISEISHVQSNSIDENHLKPLNETPKKKKGIGKVILIILLILLLLFGLFVGAVVFLFKSVDADLDTSDFMGYYSGELWITEVTMDGEEEILELMGVMQDIRMPMVVEIQEDEISEGKFILKNPSTLEDSRVFYFGGEYDQILGDTDLENGESLNMQGIVRMDEGPFVIEGFIDLANNEFMNITAEYSIKKVDELVPVDSSESDSAFDEALNTYFNKMLGDGFEDMDLDDPSLIENNDVDPSLIENNDADSSFIENNQDENLIPDEGLPSVKQSTVTGAWALNDGYGETFIIFDEGEFYFPYMEETYTWNNEGFALFYLDEDLIVVPYEIQADRVVIDFEEYGNDLEYDLNESVYYVKHNDTSYQYTFNSLDKYGDLDYTKVDIIEKDIPSNMDKLLLFVIEAEIDESTKTLNGIMHVDFVNGNVVDTKLTGQKIQ